MYELKPLACDAAALDGLSYHIDYGAKAAGYVDAYMKNINAAMRSRVQRDGGLKPKQAL